MKDKSTYELDTADPKTKKFLEAVVKEQDRIMQLKEVSQDSLKKVINC